MFYKNKKFLFYLKKIHYLGVRYLIWHLLPKLIFELFKSTYKKPKYYKPLRITKNSYLGERCFIVGTGPSINQLDLSLLRNEIIFSVNRGYLLLKKGLPHIDFYALSDMNTIKSYGDEINFNKFNEVFLIGPMDLGGKENYYNNISTFKMYKWNWMARFKRVMFYRFFQFDITKPIAYSPTVVLSQLQIAVWLGFKEIYFLGVDNDFSTENMHFYKDTEQEKKHIKTFSPTVNKNAKAFQCAKKLLNQKGVQLFNATPGGKLDALPRVNYQSLFETNNI